jgi:hypothetical protein
VEYQDEDDGYKSITRYYDTANMPVILKAGYSVVERTYDKRNRLVKEMYFGRTGDPITLKTGYAGIEKTYDEKGKLEKDTYLDAAGNETVVQGGWSNVTYEYGDKTVRAYRTPGGDVVKRQ